MGFDEDADSSDTDDDEDDEEADEDKEDDEEDVGLLISQVPSTLRTQQRNAREIMNLNCMNNKATQK